MNQNAVTEAKPFDRFEGMSPEQRLAYEADPMVQYDLLWKALGSEDVAEAFHKVHVSWARTAIGNDWRECYSCCSYANVARRVIAARRPS